MLLNFQKYIYIALQTVLELVYFDYLEIKRV